MGTRDRQKGMTPAEDLAAAVRNVIASDGEAVALTRLEISPQTLARIGAGLNVQRASIALARMRLGLPQGGDRG
jgi:hypothetical protein